MTNTTFERIEHFSEEHVEQLVALYQHEWWTKGRTEPDVRRMLEHTDIIVAFAEPGSQRLAAFARVLTDAVYKAVIFDVIVDARHRGTGLGRTLMDAIVTHPQLQGVRHMELYCKPELMPLYRKWGSTEKLAGVHFMRRVS